MDVDSGRTWGHFGKPVRPLLMFNRCYVLIWYSIQFVGGKVEIEDRRLEIGHLLPSWMVLIDKITTLVWRRRFKNSERRRRNETRPHHTSRSRR